MQTRHLVDRIALGVNGSQLQKNQLAESWR